LDLGFRALFTPKELRWKFQTKLEQAADLVFWAAGILFASGKSL